MDETVIVIMIKDKQTGFLEKELVSCAVLNHEELLLNAFASENEGKLFVVLKLTCPGEVSDKEFDAVYDCYDFDVFDGMDVACSECEDCFNPTWEFVFSFDEVTVSEKINALLDLHAKELREVFEVVRNNDLDD